jgi:Na+/phosphate symporter
MKRDIWVFLFGLGVLLFVGPFLFIFRDSLTYYLFIIWLFFIGLIFLASKYSKREDRGK